MDTKLIRNIKPLGFTWETRDPFLFSVHHNDYYPAGNGSFGPAATLEGRNLGQDFTQKDGWRMYHGSVVPGFPAHPHRGFETITIVLKGFVDHSDSHGASGRYGNGDVQWMTAGLGLQHAEMFPLLNTTEPNPLELFQIWLNLPRAKKFCKPFYTMLWAEDIPIVKAADENNKTIEIRLIAGRLDNNCAPEPAPDSWASDSAHELAIWLIKLDSGAKWTLPAASPELNRSLFFYRGNQMKIGGTSIQVSHSVDLFAGQPISIENGSEEGFLLMLQGKPINEPVIQHGPFVMNTPEEIHQAFADYQNTQFGGWPWPRHDMVHGSEKKRFANYSNGSAIIK